MQKPKTGKSRYKYDIVADRILDKIFLGEYRPGDKLPSEAQLTQDYDVSRVTLRESLKKLSMIGIVTIAQGDGTYVNEICASQFMRPLYPMLAQKRSSVEEIYEARIYIEGGTSELAALRRNDEDIDLLTELIGKLDESLEEKNWEKYNSYDAEFHQAIAVISGNATLLVIFNLLHDFVREFLGKIRVDDPVLHDTTMDHKQLLRAVSEKRPELARITMSAHLAKARAIMLANFEKGGWGKQQQPENGQKE